MFLLDTNVISELGRPSARAAPKVVAWAESVSQAELYLSVITILEIEMGILQVERRNDHIQARNLRAGWNIFDLRLLVGFCRWIRKSRCAVPNCMCPIPGMTAMH
jgi:predicted nucleic acid-binding protein